MSSEEIKTQQQSVLIISRDVYNPLLVWDYDDFRETFDVDGSYAIPKKIHWHPMSGGFDTWCQSYCVGHARACFSYGEQSIPYLKEFD